MSVAEISELDIEDIKSYKSYIDSNRQSFYIKILTLQNLIKSKMEVYEALESADSTNVAIYSELHAYKKFIDEQINDLNKLLSNYDDLIGTLGDTIKKLDIKNTCKIEEILRMD